jgi:3-hydroxy-9,10-secoandrosta-1,3,5(10)-triene-9,17-dione monooxygenase
MNALDHIAPPIPVPEPDLSPAEMIARAKRFRSKVRAEAADAERRGYYSESLHRDFAEAGFYRILQPRRFGGYEFDVATFFKVMIEISTGDPGIGWCLCLGAGHALQVASYFPLETQARIFGPDGHFIAPLSGTGTGPDCKATPVEGGYSVGGTWRYCSGVPYSTHFMGLARLIAENGSPGGIVNIVVPAPGYRMLDDWGNILGLRGSGSNSVKIEETVIPRDYVTALTFGDDLNGHTPGSLAHSDSMYAGHFLGFAAGELACSQVGAAWAALEEYERIIRKSRPRAAQHVMKYEHRDWQRVFGLALSTAHAAEAVLLRTGDLYMEHARASVDGERPFTLATAYQLQGMHHQAARLAWEAGLDCFRAASSTSALDGQPMQRYFRDLATFKNNATHQADFFAPKIAQAYFGLPILDNEL